MLQEPFLNANQSQYQKSVKYESYLLKLKRRSQFQMLVPSIFIFLLHHSITLDVYFIRHAARSPLVVPMQNVFGVPLKTLTSQGKIQSYYYGKELRNRHPNISLSSLFIYSTRFTRTRITAEYFLKGWLGIHKLGKTPFHIHPNYLPPSNITILPKEQFYYVDQSQYKNLISKTPFFKDNLNRTYRKYNVTDPRGRFILNQRVARDKKLCDKFEKTVPGSCVSQSLNEFLNFVDIANCLDFVNKSIPGVTRLSMQLPLDILNHSYRFLFQKHSFPTKGVQKDFNLVQYFYRRRANSVVALFTHDTQLFYILRTLLGVKGVFRMFKGNMVMRFLSCLHFDLKEDIAKLFFNDFQFRIWRCGDVCTTKRLFQIMNEI